jgi:DNA-binding LacI/PurR family transcriptional regulator
MVATHKVKIADIAAQAKVSATAVYSFLNGNFYGNGQKSGVGVSKTTQSRIIRACRALEYQPEDWAVRFRIYPEDGNFAFLLAQDIGGGASNVYFSLVMQGATASLKRGSPHILVGSFEKDLDYLAHPATLPTPVAAGLANKFILAGGPSYSLIVSLTQRGFPVVQLSRRVPMKGVISIYPDYRKAAQVALEHLHALGHRRIAIVGEKYFTPTSYIRMELMEGCREAVQKLGLPEEILDATFKQEEGGLKPSPLVDELLARRPRPTAIFCLDDWTATGVMGGLLYRKVRIPEEISLMGCNDDATSAKLHPSLSTVHLPTHEMGALAVQKLQEAVAAEEMPEAQEVVLPVRAMARESTAPPPTS